MKTIIAGSRSIRQMLWIETAVKDSGFEITEVVSGGAAGADAFGQQWAFKNAIPIKRFPADWKRLGRSAGPIRNAEMVAYADALVAIWDGSSRGTADVIKKARTAGLRVFVFKIEISRPLSAS